MTDHDKWKTGNYGEGHPANHCDITPECCELCQAKSVDCFYEKTAEYICAKCAETMFADALSIIADPAEECFDVKWDIDVNQETEDLVGFNGS